MLRRLAILSAACACSAALRAQDVESFWSGINERIASGEYVRTSGSLNATAALNAFRSDDGAQRRNAPLTWGATAGVNFDVLGIRAPFSLAVSSRNTRFDLPSYSFYGASPSYRWVTLHGGDRTMTFSPYSLSGVNFRGGGVELSPGRWYVASMYGRLRTDRVQDAGLIQSGLSIDDYRRFGRGLKVGYATAEGSQVAVSYFGSADRFEAGFPERSEGDTLSPARVGVLPERNAVLTVSVKQRVSSLVSLEVEAARSVLTRDDSAPELPDAGAGLSLLGLLTPRTSTAGANAFSGAVNLTPAFGNVQFKYERIEPEYRTHGSLFFQNDLENLTASVAAPLFEQRLSVAASGGLQRNDLRGDQAAALRRVIGSLNLAFAWSEGVTTSLTLSNFSTTNRYRTFDPTRPLVDSLVLAQTQLSLSGSHAMALNPEGTQSLVLSGSYQQADLVRDQEIDTSQGSTFGMGMINYSLQPSGSKHAFTAGVLANSNVTPAATTLTAGPSLGYSLSFAEERGDLSAQVNYNLTRVTLEAAPDPDVERISTGGLTSFGLSGGYRLTERQRLQLTSSYLLAQGSATRPGYSDLQLQLGYALSL